MGNSKVSPEILDSLDLRVNQMIGLGLACVWGQL